MRNVIARSRRQQHDEPCDTDGGDGDRNGAARGRTGHERGQQLPRDRHGPPPAPPLQQATAGCEPDGSEEQRGDSPHDNYGAEGFGPHGGFAVLRRARPGAGASYEPVAAPDDPEQPVDRHQNSY